MSVSAPILFATPTTNCDRFQCRPGWTRTREENAHLVDQELWFVRAGRGNLHTGTGSYEIGPGFCAWLRPGGIYEARQDDAKPFALTSIHFHVRSKGADAASQYPEFFDVWDLNYFDSITQRIVEIMRHRDADDTQKRIASLLLSGVLLDLTTRFVYQRKSAAKSVVRDHRAMVKQLVKYIYDSVGTPLTVADLATKAGYSVAHFSTLFKRINGQTAESMIVQARIDKARRLLRWSNNSISSVAVAAGYPDIYFFSRQFKLKTGLTPTEYRATRHADHLELLDVHAEPILHRGTNGAWGVKHGFEGGHVLRHQGQYHLFISEMVGDPKGVQMRFSCGTSLEGLRWQRVSTLFESSGRMDGSDPRAALWSPTPVYDPATKTWHLFYTAFRAANNSVKAFLNNHEGRAWHAVSTVPGPDGIGGPYKDCGVVLEPDHLTQPWEGLQGISSFFPYRVGDEWYAFYGSARTQNIPCDRWAVGLARAPRIGGPWKRLAKGNPVPLDDVFVERPVVTKLPADGGYLLVFDGGHRGAIGYSLSADGIHWPRAEFLVDKDAFPTWLKVMRTPLSVFLEDDGRVCVFFTGYDESYYGNLGVLHARLLTQQHQGESKLAAK